MAEQPITNVQLFPQQSSDTRSVTRQYTPPRIGDEAAQGQREELSSILGDIAQQEALRDLAYQNAMSQEAAARESLERQSQLTQRDLSRATDRLNTANVNVENFQNRPPKSYWQSLSTGEKIIAALAIGLGGFNKGVSGGRSENLPLTIFMHDAQSYAQQTKQQYEMLLRQSGVEAERVNKLTNEFSAYQNKLIDAKRKASQLELARAAASAPAGEFRLKLIDAMRSLEEAGTGRTTVSSTKKSTRVEKPEAGAMNEPKAQVKALPESVSKKINAVSSLFNTLDSFMEYQKKFGNLSNSSALAAKVLAASNNPNSSWEKVAGLLPNTGELGKLKNLYQSYRLAFGRVQSQATRSAANISGAQSSNMERSAELMRSVNILDSPKISEKKIRTMLKEAGAELKEMRDMYKNEGLLRYPQADSVFKSLVLKERNITKKFQDYVDWAKKFK